MLVYDLPQAINTLVEALKSEDKEPGSYYYSWQANIAMAFKDEYNRVRKEKGTTLNQEDVHHVANKAAENFLDMLCYVNEKNRKDSVRIMDFKMKTLSSTVINAPSGRIQIISAKKFIELIPQKEWWAGENKVEYYVSKLNSYSDRSYFGHQSVIEYLGDSPLTVTDLIKGLPIKETPKYDLIETIYDIITQSAFMMGNPTHIVRVGKRTWMAANPEDFIVFYNRNGVVLANLKPDKSVVWSVLKNIY